MTRGMSFRLVFSCLLTACACACASGQTTGRIAGVVKDPSGGIVAKAEVHAVNEATNEAWSTTTGQGGDYSFLLLPPGFYRIEVAAAGFKTAVLTDVSVRITETTIADANMAVGTRVDAVAKLLPGTGSGVRLVTDALFNKTTPGAARTLTTSWIVADP